ncbi:hypothetical protein CTA2_18 [Colletotrichum tanaceti]|nr:hypothetical protein CTA2_29 [Colletotrichum tanaceti]KAJ0169100.1 hypothetical protein CTA2_18 [Colletotrichum tanaceti]
MAIIDGLPEVNISIHINGSEAGCTEYDDHGPSPKSVGPGLATHAISRLIESQDNAEFEVHFEIQNARKWIAGIRALSVVTYVDGNRVSGECFKENSIRDKAVRGSVKGVMTNSATSGMATLKPFKFAAIKKVKEGDTHVDEDRNLAEHLGNIEVVIFRSKVLRQIPWEPLKANPDTETALQAEGIISRDPSPEPKREPQPQSVADLPLSEVQRLAQERLDQLTQCKREDEATVKRKAEEDDNPRPCKVYKIDEFGTIDLTDS